jgi:hypothetical protein
MELVGRVGSASTGSGSAGRDAGFLADRNFSASIPGIAAGEEKKVERSKRLALTADSGALFCCCWVLPF